MQRLLEIQQGPRLELLIKVKIDLLDFILGLCYIPNSLYMYLYQVSLFIYLGSHLISYPSLRPPYLGRHQNGSQRTVVRTKQLSLEPDDRRQNQMTVARTRRPSLKLDDRRQNQTTVARTRRPSLELDDCRQNQTTVARTRQPSPELDDRCQNQMTVTRTR